MSLRILTLGRSGLVLAGLVLCQSTQAAAHQRTFVSANGIDSNPCSLASPCRSFGQAISVVVDGGEVIVLDSAGYGPFAAAKSVSVIAPPGIYAGISVSSGDGVTVSAGSLVLRGLTINGVGSTGFGVTLGGGSKHRIENCTISNMGGGISANAGGAAEILVIDSTIKDSLQQGIIAGGGAKVRLERVRIERAQGDGLLMSSSAILTVRDSAIIDSGGRGIYALQTGTATQSLSLYNSLVEGSGTAGIGFILAAGLGTMDLVISGSTIQRNQTDGVSLDALALRTTIIDSVIAYNGSRGIFSTSGNSANEVLLKNNTIAKNGGCGIELNGNASALSTGTNAIQGNGSNLCGSLSLYPPQ